MKINLNIMYKMTFFYIIILVIIAIIIFLMFTRNKIIDNFDNLESNLYTYDSCCLEGEKENCMKYGKTGVCNYFKNNNECLCQNAY